MRLEGRHKFTKIGGSYAFIMPKQWATDNRLDQHKEVYVKIEDKSIIIVPLSDQYRMPRLDQDAATLVKEHSMSTNLTVQGREK